MRETLRLAQGRPWGTRQGWVNQHLTLSPIWGTSDLKSESFLSAAKNPDNACTMNAVITLWILRHSVPQNDSAA